jgi:hypothetical protein
MTKSILPPRVPQQIGRTKGRVSDLERRLARAQPQPLPYVAKFSLGGPLYASTSGAEYHPRGGRLIMMRADLNTAGTDTTTLLFLKNGTQFAQLLLPAGRRYNELVVSVPFSAWSDRLQVEIDSVGNEADTLTVYGEFDS